VPAIQYSNFQTKVTLGITPVLAEQLADPLVISHFEEYMEREIAAATEEVQRFGKSGDQHFLYLAYFYLDFLDQLDLKRVHLVGARLLRGNSQPMMRTPKTTFAQA
jgi:1,4-alpha-glucan branching enzyme